MSTVSQLHPKEQIQEQACLWISKIDRGLSETEHRQLVLWCGESKSQHNMLMEMAAYWDNLSVLNQLSALFPLEQPRKQARRKFGAIAMAASLIFVSLLSANLLLKDNLLPFFNDKLVRAQQFSTELGQQENITLGDGSSILLNTNSIINVSFSSSHRQITLIRGEASFDVAKDTSRPFTVTAGQQSFTALGTVFNVQKNDEQAMELVVTEGRVLVTPAQENLEQISQILTELSPQQLPGILVTSGEKIVIAQHKEAPVVKVPLAQMQRDLAWQQGMLIFEGEPLAQALIEVSRYSTTKFKITDPQLAQLKVAGYFKAGDIDGLLASLNSNFGITSTHSDNNLILLSAAD